MNKTKRTRVIVDWSEITVDGRPVCWVAVLNDGEVITALDLPIATTAETGPDDSVPDQVTDRRVEDLIDLPQVGDMNDPQVGSLVVDPSGMNATQRRLQERGSLLQQMVDEGRL